MPLGPNWAPTWPPKPSPNPAKLAPRSIKKSIIWVLVGKMCQVAKNPKFADSSTLLIDFWCLGRLTWQAKPTQIRSKSLPKSFRQVYLGPTWLNLAQLGSSLVQLGSTWLQLGSSLVQLGSILVQLGSTWLQLGRQNPPQIQPSWLQDPSKNLSYGFWLARCLR